MKMIGSMIKYMFLLSIGTVLNDPVEIELLLIDKIIKHSIATSCLLNAVENKDVDANVIPKAINEKESHKEAKTLNLTIKTISTQIYSQLSSITNNDAAIKKIKEACECLTRIERSEYISNESLEKKLQSMVRILIVSIALSNNILTDRDISKQYDYSLYNNDIGSSLTQAICSVSVRPNRDQSFIKLFFKTFIEQPNISKGTILEILGLLVDIENVLANDKDYPTQQFKGIKIINILVSCESSCVRNLRVPYSEIEHELKIIEHEIWTHLRKYSDIFDRESEEIEPRFSIRSLYEAKYISEADIKKLCNACCAFYDPKLGLDEKVRLDVLKRRYLNFILFEIIFNAFGLIEIAYNGNETNSDGLNTVQYIFKSLNSYYSENIVERVISRSNFTDENFSMQNYMTSVVKTLGIYSCFPEIKEAYLNILKYKTLFEECNAVFGHLGRYKNLCGIFIIYCAELIIRMKESIEKPDCEILKNICLQISIMYGIIKINRNKFVLAKELLRFISEIRNFTSDSTIDNLKFRIDDLMFFLGQTIDYISIHIELSNTNSFCIIINSMLKTISIDIKTDINNFISSCCLVIAELSKNIQYSGIIEELEISKFTNIEDLFISICNDSVGDTQLNSCFLMTLQKFLRSLSPTEKIKYTNSISLLNCICHIVTDSNSSCTSLEIVSHSARFFEELLSKIQINNLFQDDDQLFVVICSFIQQYIELLEVMGYKKGIEVEAATNCYICTADIDQNYIKHLNCVCKLSSIHTHFHCIIKYDVIRFRNSKITKFIPECSICRK